MANELYDINDNDIFDNVVTNCIHDQKKIFEKLSKTIANLEISVH